MTEEELSRTFFTWQQIAVLHSNLLVCFYNTVLHHGVLLTPFDFLMLPSTVLCIKAET